MGLVNLPVCAVIPTVIIQLLAGSIEIRLGSIHPTSDFNFVRDTVDGFIAIAETQATIGEEINIPSQQEISIGQIAREIIDQINPRWRAGQIRLQLLQRKLLKHNIGLRFVWKSVLVRFQIQNYYNWRILYVNIHYC